jgi:hypothetical protein
MEAPGFVPNAAIGFGGSPSGKTIKLKISHFLCRWIDEHQHLH